MKEHLSLYFIMGSTNTLARDPLSVLDEALEAGITLFQLREKGEGALTGVAKEEFAKACLQKCREAHIPFIMNDEIALAQKIGADGVHIGQEDISLPKARALLGNQMWIGVSAHNPEEALIAQKNGADYIGMGPIFETSTKKDTRPVSGDEQLIATRKLLPNFPIVAIGGINHDNLHIPLLAGADGVAIISAISKAEQPYQATIHLKQKIQEVKQHG